MAFVGRVARLRDYGAEACAAPKISMHEVA